MLDLTPVLLGLAGIPGWSLALAQSPEAAHSPKLLLHLVWKVLHLFIVGGKQNDNRRHVNKMQKKFKIKSAIFINLLENEEPELRSCMSTEDTGIRIKTIWFVSQKYNLCRAIFGDVWLWCSVHNSFTEVSQHSTYLKGLLRFGKDLSNICIDPLLTLGWSLWSMV